MIQKIKSVHYFLVWLSIFVILQGLSCTTHAEIIASYSAASFKETLLRPFKRNSASSAVESLSNQPSLIWSRIRNQFSLPAHEGNARVQFYIKRFTQTPGQLNEMIKNASPYLYYVVQEVEKHGVPLEIALLPLVESEYNPFANSNRGARGLWQIMPETGRYYGLSRDTWFDGCQDIHLSTKAAIQHLKYLNRNFNGNWLHTLAAYNSGENRVKNAIKKNKQQNLSTDYWSLALPKQTRDYIPKLMALVNIIKAPQKYGVQLPEIQNRPFFEKVSIPKPVDLQQAAKLMDVSEKSLIQLNPGFYKKKMHPENHYHLCVPVHAAGKVKNKVSSLSTVKANVASTNNCLNGNTHKIVAGDTLSHLAKRYGTTVETLRRINQLPNDILQIGKVLTISTTAVAQNQNIQKDAPIIHVVKSENVQKDAPIIHVVRSGESLETISLKYNVRVSTLLAKNNLKENTIVHPGQKIVIRSA